MADAAAESFRSFDWEASEQWRKAQQALELPAGPRGEELLARFRAKWFKREIDPELDISAVLGEQKPASAAPDKPAAAQPTGPPHNGAHGPRPTAASATPPRGFLGKLLGLLSSNHQERLFFMHAALIVFALLHVQPLAPALSRRAWGYFMQTALISHAYKVYLKYGGPRLRPFSLEAVKAWAQPATASTDFQYALVALIFIAARPILLVMVPMLTLAVYHFFAYAARHHSQTGVWQRYGARAHQWLVARQQQALLYNAAAEIGAGFLTLLGLLTPPRSFLLPFIYWQFLRMRFWSPDAANYHRMAWSQLDAKFGRYLTAIPLLRTPLGYAQRWFLSVPGQ